MSEIVVVDVGGTHARFAVADVEDGRVRSLGEACTLLTADHDGIEAAWSAFRARSQRPLPTSAAIAVAGRVGGDVLKLTNSEWRIDPELLRQELGLDRLTVVNDFGAVAHAVAQLDEAEHRHVRGPEGGLPRVGVITIVGPGTGLGVAQLVRRGAAYEVVETEGGHIDFAPIDAVEDRILVHLRERYGRVSVERLAGGAGLANIRAALAAIEARPAPPSDDKELWASALDGSDSLAVAALDRYCLCLGAIAGDLALAQGAAAVVIAGGLGLRLAGHLAQSGFGGRFIAKGRFEPLMAAMPVKLLAFSQPGLFGAAAAFAQEHG